MWQGLAADGLDQSFLYNNTVGAVGTPQTCPHHASCKNRMHRPFFTCPAQKQNSPPLQLDEASTHQSLPQPVASPVPSQLPRSPPMLPGICQAPLHKLSPSANPTQNHSHHPLRGSGCTSSICAAAPQPKVVPHQRLGTHQLSLHALTQLSHISVAACNTFP